MGGLDDLLADPNQKGPAKKTTKRKNISKSKVIDRVEEKKEYFSVYGSVAVKEKIQNLIWIEKYIEFKDPTVGSIIEEAIELLAIEKNYSEMLKKHGDKMKKHKLRRGRSS